MKEKSIIVETVKVLGAMIAGLTLWTFIFACMPGESVEANEPFANASLVFAIITVVIILFVIKYNTVTTLYQGVKAARSNIQIYEEKEERLLEKANKVADKYMNFEERVQMGVSEIRGRSGNFDVNAEKRLPFIVRRNFRQ